MSINLNPQLYSTVSPRESVSQVNDMVDSINDSSTPVHLLCKQQNWRSAEMLIESGSDVNICDKVCVCMVTCYYLYKWISFATEAIMHVVWLGWKFSSLLCMQI